MLIMNNGIFFTGLIVSIIFISGCIKQEGKITKFNITVEDKDGFENTTVEINNIVLPIDSEKEACDLWNQIQKGYICRFTEETDYWAFDNGLDCPENWSRPYPCGGGCIGKINKITGNVKNLSCLTVG